MQVCLGAPSTFSDATIQEIRNDLEGLPGMHTKAIEDIVITLKKFEDDPVNISDFPRLKFYSVAKIVSICLQMIELINLALQGDTCTKNAIDLKYILGVAYRISGEKLNIKYQNLSSTLSFTAKQLEVIEADLNKHFTSQKAEHVMKILRAYHSVRTHQQQEADAVNVESIKRNSFNVSFGD